MKEPINIQARTMAAPPPGLDIGDLQYIFFRHKWKILLIFLAGLGAAIGLYLLKPPLYQSEAKILIRYILENRGMLPETPDSRVVTPDSRGDNIINSELEILTSLDLAGVVAVAIGPEKILAGFGGGNDPRLAAAVIRRGIMVEVPRRSSIVRVLYQHPDPVIAQSVLRQLLDTYLTRHREIHQGVGVVDEFISRQRDSFRSKLSATEEELKKLKNDAQVISLEDTKRAYISQVTRIQDELLEAEAQLAERKAALGEFAQTLTTQPDTNIVVEPVPPAEAEQYRAVVAEVEGLRQRERELLLRLAAEHPFVKSVRALLGEALARKQELEGKTPALLSVVLPQAGTSGAVTNNLALEKSRILALQARIDILTNQLAEVSAAAAKVVEAEPRIIQLQRQRDLEEASYRSYSASLDKQRMDDSLSAGKITNISVVQNPSPARRDMNELYKPMAAVLAVGLLGGFALAFLLEKYLSQSIKRVVDLERVLHVPLLVSMPDTSWRRRFRFRRASRNGSGSKPQSTGSPAPAPGTEGVSSAARSGAVAPWEPDHELRAHYEALRDRLVTHFEVLNLIRKPKLVAVTSCHRGAGVTTLASGLAAALSETGDGNVLLVDMNLEQGAAHPFHKGKPECGLSEAFGSGKPEAAMINENLYLVSAQESNPQKLPRVLPKRFANLVPKMKASDYDYIIFDMPPISQTSVTPRLSSFMDMTLLVVESEKTGKELAKRASALLHESKATVSAVLNKNRGYVPAGLRQEL